MCPGVLRCNALRFSCELALDFAFRTAKCSRKDLDRHDLLFQALLCWYPHVEPPNLSALSLRLDAHCLLSHSETLTIAESKVDAGAYK